MESFPRFFQAPRRHFFLFGPRGTGKTTWLREAFPDALRMDLLQPDQERLYRGRPERLREHLAAHPRATVIVIDEIQRVPELLPLVHSLIEEGGEARFVLTGSSARKLKREGVDLLAGRAVLRRMHPFMAAELGPSFRLERALRQGLVPLVWDSDEPEDTLRSYLALYIREEVQAEGLTRNLGDFHRFVEAISFSHASVLNLSAIARECEVQRKTVEAYLGILEDLLLAVRLPVFTRRARRHLASHPKFFWFDAGVFRAARPRGPLDSPSEVAGPALEGLVLQHLRAWNELGGDEHQLAYWRTKAGNEVDFVVYGPDQFTALEIKHSTTAQAIDTRSLRAFLADYPEATATLLYRGSTRLRLGEVLVLPVEEFLANLHPGNPLPQ